MVLNDAFSNQNLLAELSNAFSQRRSFENESAKVLPKGYPLVVLKNFLQEDFARELKEAVMSLPFKHKATDLFDFYQSYDLRPYLDELTSPIGRVCKQIFSPPFTSTISQIIGKPIGTQIDFAAQKYLKGQYLLCHDDRLESRRVAFVLYLVDKAWTPQDGGQFEKFGMDYKGSPSNELADSFTPSWNTLVFFEVSMWSHHQVAEVLGSLPRLSVAGWLHDLPRTDLIDCSFPDVEIKSRMLVNPDAAWLRELIQPSTFDLPSYLDYPTWPICIKVSEGDVFDETLQVAVDRRIYLLCAINGDAKVNELRLNEGKTLIQTEPRVKIAPLEASCTVAYWSFLLPH